jgi:streptogramin lyase
VEVDPSAGSVVQHIDAGGPPWDVQVGFGSVWASVQGPDEVLRIDPSNGSITARIKSGPSVSGLAITSDEVWVANQGGTTIDRIDPETDKLRSPVELSDPPFWFAVGPNSVIASMTSADSVAVIDSSTGKVIHVTEVGTRPHDPGYVGGAFWMPSQLTYDASVLDAATGDPLGTIDLSGSSNPFVAEEALGDGWILDFGGSVAYRIKASAGLP